MKNVKSLQQIDSSRFVDNNVQKALKNGSHVVTLRDNGKVSPKDLAVAGRMAGLFCEVEGLTVKMAVKKIVETAAE
jgi:hypothetical protein